MTEEAGEARDATPVESPDDSGLRAERLPAPLSRNKNFQLLWVGQVLSDLGSGLGTLAYPLLILALTGSALIAGAVATITSIVAFAVRLPAGALSDRLDRRWTMIACDSVRTAALGALGLGVAFHVVAWPVVLTVAIVDRVGDTIFGAASTAALPAIVHDSQLESAWAATEARQYIASLGGPALGGVLFGLGRAVPFVGDAVSYGVSAVTSAGLSGRFKTDEPTNERQGLWRESFEGLRLIWHDALLRAVVAQAPLINFAFTGTTYAVILGLRHSGRSPTVVGLTEAAMMTGGLLGAIAAPRIQGKISLSRLVVLLTGAGTALFAVAAFLMPSPLVALPLAVPLFLAPSANAALFAAMLRATPEEMRGRVTNALVQAATGLAALAPVIAGVLVADVSSGWALGCFAVALAVSTVVALKAKGLSQAEAAAS